MQLVVILVIVLHGQYGVFLCIKLTYSLHGPIV